MYAFECNFEMFDIGASFYHETHKEKKDRLGTRNLNSTSVEFDMFPTEVKKPRLSQSVSTFSVNTRLFALASASPLLNKTSLSPDLQLANQCSILRCHQEKCPIYKCSLQQ
jgi:hypothetical protein